MPSYNPYEQKILGYEQQRKTAEALRQMPNSKAGEMVGQHFVATSPLSNIADVLRAFASSKMESDARQGIETTRAEQGQALKDWQAQMPTTKTEEMAGPAFEGVAPTRTTKPTAEDYMAWGQQGMAIDPSAAQMGMQGANMQLTRESNEATRQAALLNSQAARQEGYANQRQIAQMGIDGRRDLAVALKGMSGQGPSGQVKLSPTQQKELFETDEVAQSSQNVIGALQQALKVNPMAYSGYGAKARAVLRSNLPGESPEADATIQLENLMSGQALESLKATFGGNPTEGERKILLDLQASADKTPQQREAIINRAIQAANNRMQFNAQKAEAIRTGNYGKAGYSPVMQPSAQPAQQPAQGGWAIRPAGN